MNFRDTQNPGIGGLQELTSSELALIQQLGSLGDPNADRIVFWDDSAGSFAYLTAGSGLSISGTTITATGGLTVGTTTITSGTTTRVLYNNAGVLGEYTVSGSGSVAMTTSPTFTTPNLGTPSAATLTNATGLPIVAGTTGTLSVARGGTAKTAISALSIWAANSADTLVELTPGAGNSIRINAGGTAWETFTPSASVPTTITVANEASDTTSFIGFFTAASGDLGPKTNTNMTFNASTGVVTFASSVLTTTDINGGTLDGVVIGGSSAAAATVTTLGAGAITSTGLLSVTLAGTVADFKNTTDSASVQVLKLEGDRATMAANDEAYASLHLSDSAGNQDEMARITWKATTVTSTSEASRLQFAVVTAGTLADELYLTGTALSPATDGGNSLGTTTLGWQNLFGNTGFVFNIENGDWVATHSAGILTVGTGDLRVTTAGTNTASVVTVGGTQTLTSKTLTSPVIGTIASNTLTLGTGTFTTLTFDAGATDPVLTAASGILTQTTGEFRITSANVGTNADSVPTLSSTSTLTNKTLTAPKFASAGFVADANGNELILFPATVASAVNEVTISNAATGNPPEISATGGDTNIDLKLSRKGTGKIVTNGPVNHGAFTAYFTETDNGNSSTADTIDWGLSNKQKSTLTGNCTFTFIAPPGPCSLVLKLVQDATGSRTVTWPATVHWPAGSAPTLTTTANKVDIITFYWDGTTYFANSTLNFTA